MYDKPHRTYEEQLQLLASRGLAWHDRERALELLRSVGYYRLGAYVYPFRALLPESEQRVGSPVRFRSSTIRPGTTMEQVEALWSFDRALRLLVLDGVETVETGLRTQVAHVLGDETPLGTSIGKLSKPQLAGDATPGTAGARSTSGCRRTRASSTEPGTKTS